MNTSHIHEAAHAIADTLAGVSVWRVYVNPDGSGRSVNLPIGESTAELQASLVASLAGAEAARWWLGPGRYADPAGGCEDLERAEELADRIAGRLGTSRFVIMDEAALQARALVVRHEAAIGSLAVALEAAGDVLEGHELADAIARALGGRVWFRPAPDRAEPTWGPEPMPFRGQPAPATVIFAALLPPAPLRTYSTALEAILALGRRHTWRAVMMRLG